MVKPFGNVIVTIPKAVMGTSGITLKTANARNMESSEPKKIIVMSFSDQSHNIGGASILSG